ncbi:uncharacterized protein LOC110450866 isoform X1 [Mizuhopecten yessoensis]|uniref:uncharacterized protein LOC110450866 isoform X1 n=1 Tax=Mizuhopecten yessoensis TaxID=6573 RepID=UPI000B459C18|nr:uncharacterized protein LOC110450866 isoform X1 [Mizuhopecten yessoensis]
MVKTDMDLLTNECKNLNSVRKEAEAVTELIEKEVEKGFLVGPFRQPPLEQYRVSPIGLATGKYSDKKRLIVDLSALHDDNYYSSVNSMIEKEECYLSYVRVEDAVNLIQDIGTKVKRFRKLAPKADLVPHKVPLVEAVFWTSTV